MTRPRLKLTLLAALTLASCSQILGINDYEIDDRLDDAAAGDGNQAGQGNGGGSEGGNNGQAGTRNNEAGDPGMGGAPTPGGGSAGTAGSGGTNAGGAGDGGIGGDGGGPPVGELIPCDSEDCCDAADGISIGMELLSDGGFELGTVSNGDSPWTQDSTDIEGITDDLLLGWTPKSGDFYAYLTGIAGERTSLYSEDLDIPVDAGWLVVSGYRWFQIDAQDDLNADFGLIGFYSYTNDNPEELPFYWSKTANSNDGWGDTPSWTRFSYSWDAEPHQGLVRYLGLRGESDLYPEDPDPNDEVPGDASSYLFDDVSLKAFRCYERP